MSPAITILITLVVAGVGVSVGYYLRFIVAAGRKGSIELEIKQLMLDAKEKIQKLEEATEKKLEDKRHEMERELKEKQLLDMKKGEGARCLIEKRFLINVNRTSIVKWNKLKKNGRGARGQSSCRRS